MKKVFFAAAAALFILGSCAKSGWSVSGTIEGAESGTMLALEAYNAGQWYVLDSVRVGRGGVFSYTAGEPMPTADVLRLSLPGKGAVCFPVEGTDAVAIEAAAETFGTRHRLSGTPMAATVSAIDSLVASGADVDVIRRELTRYITADTTGIIAYYATGKALDNRPLFDPRESFGNRVYGAAAQVYAHYKPEDPRGHALRTAYLRGRQELGKGPAPAAQVLEVPEAGLIDIVRYDSKGDRHSLAELAGKAKGVVLSFTNYSADGSPAYNAILNDLYELYHGRGLEVYQIAFDDDEVAWKEAARNIPWTAVWNSPSDGADVLMLYNVGVLPMSFVINANGDVVARCADPKDLPKAVARLF